jgi:hypothetical protein
MFIITLCFVSPDAYSADWVLITISENEVFFVDCTSLIIEEEYITYWAMMYNDKGQSIYKSKEKLDCKKRTKQISDLTTLDSAGNIAMKKSFEDKLEWIVINPGSINDTFRLVLCDDDNNPRKDVKNFLKSWEIMLRSKGIIK